MDNFVFVEHKCARCGNDSPSIAVRSVNIDMAVIDCICDECGHRWTEVVPLKPSESVGAHGGPRHHRGRTAL